MAPKQSRVALLDSAIEQIALKGVRGMRVEEVARGAGVSPALIYHHFGDRSTLLQEALVHIGERADLYAEARGRNGHEMLRNMLCDEFQDDAAVRTNSAAWGELRDSAIFDPTLRTTIGDLTERWIDDIAGTITTGLDDGSLRPGLNARRLGARFTALAEGLSTRWLAELITTDEARSLILEAIDELAT